MNEFLQRLKQRKLCSRLRRRANRRTNNSLGKRSPTLGFVRERPLLTADDADTADRRLEVRILIREIRVIRG